MASFRDRKAWGERLRQLERLGLLLSFEHQLLGHQPSEVEVGQCANELDCPVMDMPNEQTLFVVWVSLWAERPGVRLYDFRFEPPWRDHGFVRLPSFADSHIGEGYCLPDGLGYSREAVLNFNFLKAGWRLPNTRVEGVLCALSDTPIPVEYKHGALIPVRVRFFDRAGPQLAEATVTLWADRLTHRRQKAQHTAEERIVKPLGTPNAAPKSVTAQSRCSTLYDRPGGVPDSCAEAQYVEKGSPPAAKVRESGHRSGLFGE